MRILMTTAATQRQIGPKEAPWDSIERWIDMAQKVTGIDGIYLLINDIPEPRRSILKNKCTDAGINCDYMEFGFAPENRGVRKSAKGAVWSRFAVIRNMLIRYGIKHRYDYIFSVDSDIVCRPFTIERILLHIQSDVAMVAILVNNISRFVQRRKRARSPEVIYNVCNMKGKKISGRPIIKYNTVMEVDLSGAASLINLEPFKTHNIKYVRGPSREDADLCYKLRALGYKILVDTSKDLEALHLMELRMYNNQKLIDHYLAGNLPDYNIKDST